MRLETLGGLVLSGDTGTPLPAQRRRLALLALLATAGKRGLRRDKILAYLSPDSPEAQARHALEQLIHTLRQVGDQPLILGPDPLRLNRAILTADVMDFERALEQGALGEAMRLYRGPFLDGFYLTGAAEFERWAEAERARLAEAYRSVLERLAREQAQQNDLSAAVESWRKLVAADPLSTSATLGLMRGLIALGHRSDAWQQGKAHEGVVRRELDRDPDPAVRALMAELAARSSPS